MPNQRPRPSRTLVVRSIILLVGVLLASVLWFHTRRDEGDRSSGDGLRAHAQRSLGPDRMAMSSPTRTNDDRGHDALPQYAVAGVVVDQHGIGIAGFRVFVGVVRSQVVGMAEPHEIEAFGVRQSGFLTTTDENGRFSVTLSMPEPVVVYARSQDDIDVATAEGLLSVTPPCTNIVIRGTRLSTAKIVASATDSQGNEVKKFRVAYESIGGTGTKTAEDGKAVMTFHFSDQTEAIDVKVRLARQGGDLPEPRVVKVWAGTTVDVLLTLGQEATGSGIVVDHVGLPVEGAIVFFGSFERLRENGLGHPDLRRVADGVQTAADGSFRVRGHGTLVTAWKPGSGWSSGPVGETMRLELPQGSSIDGRIDADEQLLGSVVRLDGTVTAQVDINRGFVFDGVAPGVHVLSLADGRQMLVGLAPGERESLTIGAAVEIERVSFSGVDAESLGSRSLFLIGKSANPEFWHRPIDRTKPAVHGRFLPGSYGAIAIGSFDVYDVNVRTDGTADIVAGSCEIAVHARETEGRFSVLPNYISQDLRFVIRDIVARRLDSPTLTLRSLVPDDYELTFGGLHKNVAVTTGTVSSVSF